MSLHKISNLLLVGTWYQCTQANLSFLHVWNEMTDDSTPDKTTFFSNLIHGHTLFIKVVTDFLCRGFRLFWTIRILWFSSFLTSTRTILPWTFHWRCSLIHQEELCLFLQIICHAELSALLISQKSLLQSYIFWKNRKAVFKLLLAHLVISIKVRLSD